LQINGATFSIYFFIVSDRSRFTMEHLFVEHLAQTSLVKLILNARSGYIYHYGLDTLHPIASSIVDEKARNSKTQNYLSI